jgi:hypothetical protein
MDADPSYDQWSDDREEGLDLYRSVLGDDNEGPTFGSNDKPIGW